jgi:hypothetical protein
MNQERILHAADDQFEGINQETFYGFGKISTRKKPNGGNTEYQYKIDKEGKLYTSSKEFTSIIKPKVPGEWIDVIYNGKDVYLYLECIFSVSKRYAASGRPEAYSISSASLITTDKKLPNKFSGTYSKIKDGFGAYYYEITLGRKFLAILPFHISPVQFLLSTNINLTSKNINGIITPTL